MNFHSDVNEQILIESNLKWMYIYTVRIRVGPVSTRPCMPDPLNGWQ